jgi:hypothetical protein
VFYWGVLRDGYSRREFCVDGVRGNGGKWRLCEDGRGWTWFLHHWSGSVNATFESFKSRYWHCME